MSKCLSPMKMVHPTHSYLKHKDMWLIHDIAHRPYRNLLQMFVSRSRDVAQLLHVYLAQFPTLYTLDIVPHTLAQD